MRYNAFKTRIDLAMVIGEEGNNIIGSVIERIVVLSMKKSKYLLKMLIDKAVTWLFQWILLHLYESSHFSVEKIPKIFEKCVRRHNSNKKKTRLF